MYPFRSLEAFLLGACVVLVAVKPILDYLRLSAGTHQLQAFMSDSIQYRPLME